MSLIDDKIPGQIELSTVKFFSGKCSVHCDLDHQHKQFVLEIEVEFWPNQKFKRIIIDYDEIANAKSIDDFMIHRLRKEYNIKYGRKVNVLG